ncbi:MULTISPECIES: hypothetical protein [unclassified Paenibacillus]|uniref:hypothetical protein n=1 Tax=unclassified Paenibacillus TaxID=185978 RepID=UPI000839CF0B|nr:MULTISPECIES: hypothetical protein [unclassified Paenibacillus]NWL90490.1 hypothetical protein [Paenibacillus sp. 79R4]
MSKILVEIDDLRQAKNQLDQVIHKLNQDEAYLKTVYGRLFGWKGVAGEEMRKRMNIFFNDLSKWNDRFEGRRDELVKYIDRMKQVDEMFRY